MVGRPLSAPEMKTMAHILITLAHDPTARPMYNQLAEHLGEEAAELYSAFLFDSVALAGRVSWARTAIVAPAPSPLVEQIASATGAPVLALSDEPHSSMREAVARALAEGPVVLVGGDLPHLPIWRLRD